MKYRYISDSHVHSDCSRDGTDPTMMMCESAARLGLYALTVTDHCECNAYVSEAYDRSIRQSYFEARKAAAVFHDRLHVYAGVEIGQPMQDAAAAEDVLNSCEFDFALASVHNVKNLNDFYYLDYSKISLDDALNRYFDEIIETIEWGRFDSLAHLTYPWRYIVGEHGMVIHDELYLGKIDEILKLLIKKNKALEVNTSGFRQKLGKSMPDLPVLLHYHDLGGKLITLGSDAHRWADVGGGVEQGLALLRQAGFNHFTIYVRHQPKFLPIE
ncbi:MAG TPA: histidinol-phosphatase HisJ family protein [Caproiciproducens sp.]|nr:histidinol-phosphatase HisJ family protein [Caproiciproducens sp.]